MGSKPNAILVVRLDVNKIQPRDYSPKSRISGKDQKRLLESLLEHGQLTPILVKASEPGSEPRWHLADGHRRLAACKELGWDRIVAVVNDSQASVDELYAVLHNDDRTDREDGH
jgi:ParB family transcriptional regulator, chromosome partitioning protein